MVDLKLLTNPMTPAESPGLDTLDPRFQDIATLVEAADFTKAAEQTQALLQENIVDIRLIAYFLYAGFLETGLGALADVLDATLVLLGANWPAVGPVGKKEKHVESALSWFISHVTKKVQGAEKDKTPEWEAWSEACRSEKAQANVAKAAALRTAIGGLQPPLPSNKVQDALKQLEDWLATYERGVAAPPPPVEAPKPVEKPAEAEKPAAGAGAASSNGTYGGIEGSYHLEQLKRKIQAFEVLIGKKDYNRACVVATDIAGIVDTFDPRVYFPKLFTNFYKLSMQNLDNLAEPLAKRDTPSWVAMERLYQVDVEAFLA
jgi:hypothetical protein